MQRVSMLNASMERMNEAVRCLECVYSHQVGVVGRISSEVLGWVASHCGTLNLLNMEILRQSEALKY